MFEKPEEWSTPIIEFLADNATSSSKATSQEAANA
jgi:hypothetical protein